MSHADHTRDPWYVLHSVSLFKLLKKCTAAHGSFSTISVVHSQWVQSAVVSGMVSREQETHRGYVFLLAASLCSRPAELSNDSRESG